MPYFDRYIKLSTSSDIETTLVESHNHLVQLIQPISEEKMNFSYAEGKWTLKDMLQHLIDTERIFVYRALRFARNDKTELPGYDHNEYANETNADEKSKEEILESLAQNSDLTKDEIESIKKILDQKSSEKIKVSDVIKIKLENIEKEKARNIVRLDMLNQILEKHKNQ